MSDLRIVRRARIEGPGEGFVVFCPGCRCGHLFKVGAGHPWTWNGDFEKPTFNLSMLVWEEDPETSRRVRQCHSFVREGMIQFLSDCTHELRDKTVPLEPF